MTNGGGVEIELANRLTIKELGVNPAKALKEAGANKVAVARMYGTVSRVGFQEDRDKGQSYTYFVGTFEGVNLKTGETVAAAKLYLPEGAAQALEHKVNSIHEKRGKNASVSFGFEIYVVKNEETKSGYTYQTHTLLTPAEADLLLNVRAAVASAASEHAEKDQSKKGAESSQQKKAS